MKNLFKVSALVFGLGFGGAASAAMFSPVPTAGTSYNLIASPSYDSFTIATIQNGATFSHTWNLFVDQGEAADVSFFNFPSGMFVNIDGFDVTSTSPILPSTTSNSFVFDDISSGIYTFTVTGDAVGLVPSMSGMYSAGLVVSEATQPVPEPEEWAMMMLGLPLMGFVARRRKSSDSIYFQAVAA